MTCGGRWICHRSWFETRKVLCFCFSAKNTSPNAELVCDSDSSLRRSKAEPQKARTFAKSLKASYTDSSAPALYFPDGKFIFPQLLAVGQAASGRSALIARPEAKCCVEDFCLAVIHFQMQRETQRSTCSAFSSLHRLWATRNKILPSQTFIYRHPLTSFFQISARR